MFTHWPNFVRRGRTGELLALLHSAASDASLLHAQLLARINVSLSLLLYVSLPYSFARLCHFTTFCGRRYRGTRARAPRRQPAHAPKLEQHKSHDLCCAGVHGAGVRGVASHDNGADAGQVACPLLCVTRWMTCDQAIRGSPTKRIRTASRSLRRECRFAPAKLQA